MWKEKAINRNNPKLTQTIELIGDAIREVTVAISHILMKVEERLSVLSRDIEI